MGLIIFGQPNKSHHTTYLVLFILVDRYHPLKVHQYLMGGAFLLDLQPKQKIWHKLFTKYVLSHHLKNILI